MSYLRKFGLVVSAIAFCMSVYVATADAQWRQNRNWENRERSVYSDRNTNRRWDNNRSVYRGQNRNGYWQQNRYGRLTPQEYWRLQRQRSRIYRNADRYSRDGYLSSRERLRLMRQQNRYRRNVYRERRDW